MSYDDALQAIRKLENQPKTIAGLVKTYRDKVSKVNADENLSEKGRDKKVQEFRNEAAKDLAGIEQTISANQAAARENLEAATARPDVSGVEGELKHSRVFGRVQAMVSNGQQLNQIVHSADRDTLAVIREEAPYYWPNEAAGIEKMAAQRDRALMPTDERRAHEQLEEFEAGKHRLDMGLSQAKDEINGEGMATFIPAYHADQQGHTLLEAPDSAA